MYRTISIFTLCMAALLTCVQPATAATVSSDATISTQQEKPPKNKCTQATTDIYTRENEQWFSELLTLNPQAIALPDGEGFTVTNPEHLPLVLPRGDKPDDVTLQLPAK